MVFLRLPKYPFARFSIRLWLAFVVVPRLTLDIFFTLSAHWQEVPQHDFSIAFREHLLASVCAFHILRSF